MSGYSSLVWLIIAALLGYVWLLRKIAEPKAITQPVTESKVWLITQTVIAWLGAFLSVVLCVIVVKGSDFTLHANRQRFQNPGDVATSLGLLIVDLGVLLLVALSVRWTRKAMRKWKAPRLPTAAEAKHS